LQLIAFDIGWEQDTLSASVTAAAAILELGFWRQMSVFNAANLQN
jgi:hypothetical protein